MRSMNLLLHSLCPPKVTDTTIITFLVHSTVPQFDDQVLTEAKRGKIRARKGEIDRLEKDAKKTMVRMEDKDEMLAAAGSIPVPAGPTPTPGVERDDRKKRSRSPGTEGEDRTWAGAGDRVDGDERDTWRVKDRDPLSAWVSECYNHDDYAGHVTDLRHFLRGIDFHHVSRLLFRSFFFYCGETFKVHFSSYHGCRNL